MASYVVAVSSPAKKTSISDVVLDVIKRKIPPFSGIEPRLFSLKTATLPIELSEFITSRKRKKTYIIYNDTLDTTSEL